MVLNQQNQTHWNNHVLTYYTWLWIISKGYSHVQIRVEYAEFLCPHIMNCLINKYFMDEWVDF